MSGPVTPAARPARSFEEMLEQGVVVFDGAVGTELYRRGIFINRCFDELNLSAPDAVRDVHRAYVKTGVDVIETNTFGANRPKLEQHGLADEVSRINEAGARIARKIAGDSVFVAGAMGPLGLRIEPWGPTGVDEPRWSTRMSNISVRLIYGPIQDHTVA